MRDEMPAIGSKQAIEVVFEMARELTGQMHPVDQKIWLSWLDGNQKRRGRKPIDELTVLEEVTDRVTRRVEKASARDPSVMAVLEVIGER
jgi:hypothetical protein